MNGEQHLVYGNTVSAIPSPVTGSDDVQVSAVLTDLQSASTYHFRIKASNAVDVVYSDDKVFTTEISLPQLITFEISNITAFSATSGGNITYDGGSPVIDRGVVWSIESNPTIDNHAGITNDGVGDGSFFSELTELLPGTFYYMRAYATNDSGTAYGNQYSFTTLGSIPTATTSAASGITTTSAVLNGVANPKHLSTTVIFEYGLTTEYGNTVTATQSPVVGNTNISVNAEISGLPPGAKYYFRIKAENELGMTYGNQRTFTTLGQVPTVFSTQKATEITNELGVSYGEEAQFKTYGTVTDIDNNLYYTIIIGNQEWMAENLRVTKYNNGVAIPTGLNDAEWKNTTSGAYAIYPHGSIPGLNSDGEVLEAYGALYNWHAVNTGNLCPEGWSVPSDANWTALVNYVVSQGYPNTMANPNGAGNALKSCRQVGSPLEGCNTSEHPRWNSHGTHSGFDEFGFLLFPAATAGQIGFSTMLAYKRTGGVLPPCLAMAVTLRGVGA